MARIRTIKPEFWTHEDLSALPEATHMLAAALLNHADDEGYFNANPGLVRAACSPLREPSVSIHDSLNLLAAAGFIQLGIGTDGKRYGRVVTFDDHQRVNRPTPSKIKALGVVWEDSPKAHAQLSESSPPERNREQGTGKGREQGEASPPSSAEAADPAPAKTTEPVDLPARKAQRLSQVTTEAIDAFNASQLVKANGGRLASVSTTVGRERRQKQVERCLRTARAISLESYGSQHVPAQFWVDYWAAVHEDDFHAGRSRGGPGHENWVPDFEFLTREATMLKVYDRTSDEAAA